MTAVPARQTPYTVGEEVLRYLGLDPRAPETKALVLLCERYALDPVLGHARIISMSPYITRDGYIEIAHRSGQLDGIVVDELRRNSTGDGWTAYVCVYRKDMSHPFRYGAQCRDNESQSKKGWGPDQAIARAERRALKRAFNVMAADPTDPGDDEIVAVEPVPARAVEVGLVPEDHDQESGTDPFVELTQSEAHAVIGSLTPAEQGDFLARHRIPEFGMEWPPVALIDAAHIAQEPF